MSASTPTPPNAVEILQRLIQFDTTNPPGNERACLLYLHGLLADAGFTPELYAKSEARPNLLARLPGRGDAPPLLLYGHVDVVTTEGQTWQVPPFEGRLQDGYVWGRGAVDMKGAVAMMVAALLRAKAEGLVPRREIILAAVADEEHGSEYGARFLVQQHPELFAGVKHALGEFGGFNLTMSGVRFYPIMIAEKQTCWLKLTFRGQGGHASMPVRGQAMAKLAAALIKLDRQQLPVHITPPVASMIGALAANLRGPTGFVLRGLLNPALTNILLGALGERASLFAPLLHNTVSPTMLQASDKINVIPGEVAVGLDGRLVPGATPDVLLAELRDLLGDDYVVEVALSEPGPAAVDTSLFPALGAILTALDPAGRPIPYVLSGVTDARYFCQLGIQTYGFTPLRLPEDFNFVRTVHAADERVPAAALEFGAEALYRALQI
jgi:acetylornithine deacetylase/succinyl-diaminopimelate desuccinylase-like protein